MTFFHSFFWLPCSVLRRYKLALIGFVFSPAKCPYFLVLYCYQRAYNNFGSTQIGFVFNFFSVICPSDLCLLSFETCPGIVADDAGLASLGDKLFCIFLTHKAGLEAKYWMFMLCFDLISPWFFKIYLFLTSVFCLLYSVFYVFYPKSPLIQRKSIFPRKMSMTRHSSLKIYRTP